jgi:hypothetical protein
MNRKIQVEFAEETPSFEVQPLTRRGSDNSVPGVVRRRFWLGWQLFGTERRD